MEDIKKTALPFICPSCKAKTQTIIGMVLQSKKVQCPKCKNIFTFGSSDIYKFQNAVKYVESAAKKIAAAKNDFEKATEKMGEQFQELMLNKSKGLEKLFKSLK